MRLLVLFGLLLTACGGATDRELQVTVRYQRSASPNAGCAPCSATVSMPSSTYDGILRCYPKCSTSAPSVDTRVIDCSPLCGVELEGIHYYDATCAYDVPDPARPTRRCY